MSEYLVLLIIGLIMGLMIASFTHTKKNYYKSYDGLIQLNEYKNKTDKVDEVVRHDVREDLYFTMSSLMGDVEIKVYANVSSEMRCVETIQEDLWNKFNGLVKFRSQYKKDIEQYLLEARQKMFKETKERLTQLA